MVLQLRGGFWINDDDAQWVAKDAAGDGRGEMSLEWFWYGHGSKPWYPFVNIKIDGIYGCEYPPKYGTILAKSYPYSKADHIPCENSSGNLGKNDWPLMVKIKFCDPCQARLFSCHVLSCPRARVQPAVRTCESMVSQIIFLDRICRRVFFINRSGRSGHWGEGLKANRELGQVWKITLPLEPKWQ